MVKLVVGLFVRGPHWLFRRGAIVFVVGHVIFETDEFDSPADPKKCIEDEGVTRILNILFCSFYEDF